MTDISKTRVVFNLHSNTQLGREMLEILIFLIWHIFFDNINNNNFSVLVPFYAANTIHAVPSSFSPVSFAQYSRNHMHVF